MGKPIVIVGAGLGGLALALRLAHRGENVLVLEKTDQVGGRNREVRVGECVFDGGPTLLMMLPPFRKLFADVGEDLDKALSLEKLDPTYRVFFSGGKRVEATTDQALMASRVRELCGEADEAAYRKLMPELKKLYDESVPAFVERNYDSPLELASPSGVGIVLRNSMLANYGRRIQRKFKTEKARMMFSFQTMYLGLSPFDAPWVYATLAYMEYGEGIWYPKGGIVEIARAIARHAEARGANIRLESAVCRASEDEVELESGEKIAAKAVVLNADLPYAEGLIGTPKPRRRSSCSALMTYLDYEGEIPELLHHNVFFGADFAGNLDEIFRKLEPPSDPAFYAAISARSDPEKAPKGHENLYLLIPCANLDRPWSKAEGDQIREKVYARLEAETSFKRDRIRGMKEFTPEDWQSTLNLDRGAAFGISHDFFQSAAFRPNNRVRKGLYFVGASTVPGNGMPMVLISADLAERRLQADSLLGVE